jgi:hypothetical protein
MNDILRTIPTLKRGARDRCASSAIEIGTRLVNKMDSCDCPGPGTQAATFSLNRCPTFPGETVDLRQFTAGILCFKPGSVAPRLHLMSRAVQFPEADYN